MRTITLDGREMKDIQTAHTYIEAQLELRDFYGKNLDALWDALTGIGSETCLKITHYSDARNYLGDDAGKLQQVFTDAAVENPFLQITFS